MKPIFGYKLTFWKCIFLECCGIHKDYFRLKNVSIFILLSFQTLAVLLAIEIALSQDLGISQQKRKFDALLKQFGFSSSIPSSVVKRPEPSLQSSDLRQTGKYNNCLFIA